jgi:hypothetical protein
MFGFAGSGVPAYRPGATGRRNAPRERQATSDHG